MVFLNQRVLFVLTFSFAAETMCGCAKIPQYDDCSKNPPREVATMKVNFSRHLVREKREPPEATVAYYDFLVNEFSFKVWATFEMVTIALLFYSTFAAIYYARWTYLRQDFTDEDPSDLLRRSHERLIRALQHPPGR